jgi:hypothetical protein
MAEFPGLKPWAKSSRHFVAFSKRGKLTDPVYFPPTNLALGELSSDRRLDRQYLKERSHRSEQGVAVR